MNKINNPSGAARGGIWDLLKIILAVSLLIYVFSRTDFTQLLSMTKRLSSLYLSLNFLLLAMLSMLKAFQYRYITGSKTGYFRVLGIVLFQNAMSNFVASSAGIATYVTMMGAEKEVRVARATVSFLVVKMADLMAVLVLMTAWYVWLKPIPVVLERIYFVAAGISLFILFFFFAALVFRRKFVDLMSMIIHWIKIDHFWFVKQPLELFGSLADENISRLLKLLAGSVAISFLYMTCTLLWSYARFHTFSLDVGFGVIALITCLLQLASWVPVFILGGLGVSESIAVFSLTSFGIDSSEAAAVLIAGRLVFYLMNALFLLYIPLGSLVAKFRNSP